MRILSLVPAGTEIVCALGLGDRLVGVTHACAPPPRHRGLPVVLFPRTDLADLGSTAIDDVVRAAANGRQSLYQVDTDRIRRLEPDVVITQDLCQVCGISTAATQEVMAALSGRPQVVTLHAHTLADTLTDIRRVGAATAATARAQLLISRLQRRLHRVRALTAGAPRRRVVCLEWLNPLFSAGHWVPEMVGLAGGVEMLAAPGQRSRTVEWNAVTAVDPETLVLMPCGFDLDRTRSAAHLLSKRPGWKRLQAVQAGDVWATDAGRLFSGAGPRLVEGVEVLAAILHPDRAGGFAPPDTALPVVV